MSNIIKFFNAEGKLLEYTIRGEEIIYSDMDNFFHNDAGPAYILADYYAYFSHGKCHRIDGPATNRHEVFEESWWYQGKMFASKADWFEALTAEEKRNYLWKINEI